MPKLNNIFTFLRKQPRWRYLLGLVVVAGGAAFLFLGRGKGSSTAPVFEARRGPLEINVLEGGSLQALESQEIKCEVRVGYQGTKILKIVEEGYLVTDDDVKTNKVLVELDSSDLQKQLVQQEIQFESAVASLIDAEQNYEIQLSQNLSDVKAAEQKARFARLDFDKFLGDTVTVQIIQQVGLDRLLAEASTNNVEQTSRAEGETESQKPVPAKPGPSDLPPILPNGPKPSEQAVILQGATVQKRAPGTAGNGQDLAAAAVSGTPAPQPAHPEDASEAEAAKEIKVDFSPYANLEKLGDGEAKQKVRKFEDDWQVSQKELGQAKTTLEGTQRLFTKGFVTKTDLQRDEIAFENSRLKVQTAESARDLFLKYDFLKSAEESLSKYAEAVRELDKARRVAISRLAQAKAKLKSAQGQHGVQKRQLEDIKQQLGLCIIHATKPGLVVYGSAGEDMFFYGGEERIREGATVRERQAIITIPDMTMMAVKVKIHETYIKKIRKGQKVRVTVDAFPDKQLNGEVTKVGVLPDSQNRWMNPDLKVYLTTITIDGTHDWVKPGMSSKVEILVNKIDDCVYVPVQAVSPDGDKQVCFVARGMASERRPVEIGEFNDEFIQIKSGLREGERVLLRPPETDDSAKGGKSSKPPESTKPPAPAPATTTPASVAAKSGKA